MMETKQESTPPASSLVQTLVKSLNSSPVLFDNFSDVCDLVKLGF